MTDPLTHVPRVFSELARTDDVQEPLPLHRFFDRDALVVLADAGMGKTEAFRKAAAEEPNSGYLTVRHFLDMPPERWRGQTLYLDALDETRARTSNDAVIVDHLARRLCEAGCPRFRVACRAIDWEGSSDSEVLQHASANQQIAILRLEPLSDDDVLTIVADRTADSTGFVREAKARGLETLLQNPQTLGLLLDVVSSKDWPSTRRELFDNACNLLLSEPNKEHARSPDDQFAMEELRHAAGYLVALHLLSDVEGFALNRAVGQDDYPAILDFREPAALLRAAAHRRAFVYAGAERVTPPHRTISEFLGASYLTRRIADGLPIGRVLALVTGPDGGTLSDLRGLYAWLVTLCSEHTEELLSIDPLAAVVYGDAAEWPLSTKRLALAALRRVGETDPYFRAHHSRGEPLGALADPALTDDLALILTECRNRYHQAATVLDIARYGRRLPELGDALLCLAKDEEVDDSLRGEAIATFAHCCPDREDQLIALLGQVHEGKVADSEKLLRAALLEQLYPKRLGPSELIRFLVPSGLESYTSYAWFQSHHLPRLTPQDRLVELADALGQTEPPEDIGRHSWAGMVGGILTRLLASCDQIDPASLYRWLGTGMDRSLRSQILRNEHKSLVHGYISMRPWLWKEIFEVSLEPKFPEDIFQHWRHFKETTCGAQAPSDLSPWLLSKVDSANEPETAMAYFRLACRLLLHERAEIQDPLELLFAFVEKHDQYEDLLQRFCVCQLEDHLQQRVKFQQRSQLRYAEMQKVRRYYIGLVQDNLDAIRRGEHQEALIHAGGVWFGRFPTAVDANASPLERLVAQTSDETASVLEEGFLTLLRRDDLPSPGDCGSTREAGKIHAIRDAVIAGLDIVAARSQTEFLALPERTLASGLCLDLEVRGDQERAWPDWIKTHRPKLAADALLAFWRPLVQAGANYIPGLDDPSYLHGFPAADSMIYTLLREVPAKEGRISRTLLAAALQYCDPAEVEGLASRALDEQQGRGSNSTALHWTTAAFLAAPERWRNALDRIAARNVKNAREVYVFLNCCWEEGSYSSDHQVLAQMIRILGGTHENIDDLGESMGEEVLKRHIARFVRRMIDRLSADPGEGVSEALRRLLDEPDLSPWQDWLRHAIAVQARHRRQALFRYPDVQQIVKTLANQAPANVADLQALVLDHLQDLARHYRHGATDRWKAFWNTDGYGRATGPKGENECRDRLLDDLKPRLVKQEVAADREGSFAEEKRADIKVTALGKLVLPVEVKRHYHPDLWTAPPRQLQTLYSRDPQTGGRGIYLVLWFGEGVGRRVPTPPSGIAPPDGAQELEQRLVDVTPAKDRATIKVIVIDCAKPARS